MFDIGFLELVVVGVLGLLVLGPERLPKAARTIGLLVGRVRRTVNNFQEDLERQVRIEELKQKLRDPMATFLDQDVTNPGRLRKDVTPVENNTAENPDANQLDKPQDNPKSTDTSS
jgi:sec-independent protein translocase protein TatB